MIKETRFIFFLDIEDSMMMLKALTDPRCLLEMSGSEAEVEIQFCPDCHVLKLFAKVSCF